MEISREVIEQMIAQVLEEKIGSLGSPKNDVHRQEIAGVIMMEVPKIHVTETDRLDTGNRNDKVYTHDLFSLAESPRLGCGIMEMERTTFDWTLDYDEIDYVIDGELTIVKDRMRVTAGPGEIILIPKGSRIQFSVPERARFIYVTYPADWNK